MDEGLLTIVNLPVATDKDSMVQFSAVMATLMRGLIAWIMGVPLSLIVLYHLV
jgi:hypothetical protein